MYREHMHHNPAGSQGSHGGQFQGGGQHGGQHGGHQGGGNGGSHGGQHGGPFGPFAPLPFPVPVPFPGGTFPVGPGFGPGPGPIPGPGPVPGPGTATGAPVGAPPSFIPPKPVGGGFQTLAVNPGAIAACRFRYVYIWQSNGDAYWAYLTFVGRNSIAGFRWIGFTWVYFGLDLRFVDQFFCY